MVFFMWAGVALLYVLAFVLGIAVGALNEEKQWIKAATHGVFKIATTDDCAYSVEKVGRKLK